MFEFTVGRYRCFFQTEKVRIAPITLLVGENSTGKTSFLAALRATMEFLGQGTHPSFNRDPFYLGAFDQIANSKRGSHARSSSFWFGVTREISTNALEERARLYQIKKSIPAPGVFSIDLSFTKSGSQPRLSEVYAQYLARGLTYGLTFDYSSKDGRVVFTKDFERHQIESTQIEDILGLPDFILKDPSYAPRIIGQGGFRRRYSEKKIPFDPNQRQAIDEIMEVFSLVGTSLSIFEEMEIRALAPIRSKPRRTYDPKDDSRDSEGEYVPYRLARLKSESMDRYKGVVSELRAFGRFTGLFDNIEIKSLGKTDSDPFQVIFRLAGKKANLMDIGYGVSQSFPLIADLVFPSEPTHFLIQQPEVHLHPRAQAEFASFLVEFVKRTNSFVVLETHSDYIVDRLRTHVRDKRLTNEMLSLLYFERKKQNQNVVVHQIKLDDKGDVTDPPKTYRNFFLREKAKILGLSDVHNN